MLLLSLLCPGIRFGDTPARWSLTLNRNRRRLSRAPDVRRLVPTKSKTGAT
jgi:hypothetical protein